MLRHYRVLARNCKTERFIKGKLLLLREFFSQKRGGLQIIFIGYIHIG